MGNLFSNCQHKDFKVETAVGNCGCASSVCTCFAKQEEETDEMTKQIAIALRVELQAIESQMKEAIIANIKKFGIIPQINVLDSGAKSPSPKTNTLSVRVKMTEPDLEYPEV